MAKAPKVIKAIFKKNGDGVCIAHNRNPANDEYVIKTKPSQWTEGWVPSRYMDEDGKFVVRKGEDIEKEKKFDALLNKLRQVDSFVKKRAGQNFEYGGNTIYPDGEFIAGIVTALPYLPEGYQETWKTADKTDGVNNVYVTLDKAGLASLGTAYLAHKKAAWSTGEAHKNALKVLYSSETATAEDIWNYKIS